MNGDPSPLAVRRERPTPLLLRYGAGGCTCLHQEVYGDLTFPLPVALMPSSPDADFTGGESVFVEAPIRFGDGWIQILIARTPFLSLRR